MTDEKPKSKKWINPPEGYKLKSDIKALCKAVVEKWAGKEFGAWYVEYSTDMLGRVERHGSAFFLSPKQEAVLAKLEVNNWPEGVKDAPATKSAALKSGVVPEPDEFGDLPF